MNEAIKHMMKISCVQKGELEDHSYSDLFMD